MKENFTFEEQQLMSIYNPGTRMGLIHALVEMRTYLDKDEQELKDLTDSAIAKLNTITDAEFAELDLIPDLNS
ncbi:MAG: transposon-transfer assisting family protein [Faecousia sp.]